jgi:hypothetical protein
VELKSKIASMLLNAGLNEEISAVKLLSSGGNNRAYRVSTRSGAYLAKQYFTHAGDLRDRLGSEYAFLVHAQRVAPGLTPRPLAADLDANLALYEFVEGRSLNAGELKDDHLEAAASFFVALNSVQDETSKQLPLASEACFAINDHIALIDARLEKLQALPRVSPENLEACKLAEAIVFGWQAIKANIRVGAQESGLDLAAPLSDDQRCISPSDFGFHNALVTPDGSLCFIDFEYAGWDDPAKMVGDFFSQLAVPVADRFFPKFVETCLSSLPRYRELLARSNLLRPAYQIKWCCIALNVFMPVNLERRKFANPELDEVSLKRDQLTKATRLFKSVHGIDHGLH